MSPTSRPGRPRNAATDTAILDAAAVRLTRDGYERMTVADVARDAGVSRPTVYRRWASKDDLVIAAVAHLIRSADHEATGDPSADLLDQADALFARWSHSRYLGLLGAAIVERRHHPAIYERLQKVLVEPRRQQLRTILEAAVRRGLVRQDIDIEVIVAMFVGSFYAMTIAGRWQHTERWPARLTDTVMDLIAAPQSAVDPADEPSAPQAHDKE